ncbi:phage head closure protein [Noviherbaspirillum suwonense]|uniref:Phage head-tail adaptor, putative, SPP1 family n=1 Tax=Noviherbaspirillum suwonense TaxID=1224511 RepID=A0ABY1QKE6_9BURK|nr:phage head closure protein [Noviherbaspirillum suwonense]SMP71954.1 phage head-tail adaptor, putative, SPP1 family [Noviherbaspirillum suwonense]
MSLGAKLKHRVMLQQRGPGRDEYGQEVDANWTDVVSVRAAVEDISGRQYVAAQATQNSVQTKVTIRQRDGIVPTMRVVWNDTNYDIEAVLETQEGTLELMCKKGVSNG